MSRINSLPHSRWPDELRTAIDPESVSPLQLAGTGILAHAPHMARANFAFLAAASSGQMLSARLLELVRLRIAFHNQCKSCMAMRYQSAVSDGLTEAAICSLDRPLESDEFSSAERAAIEFADKFSTNHHDLSDHDFSRLREHFSDAEIVELGIYCGFYVGSGRFLAAMNIVEELPSELKQVEGPAGPWMVKRTVPVGR